MQERFNSFQLLVEALFWRFVLQENRCTIIWEIMFPLLAGPRCNKMFAEATTCSMKPMRIIDGPMLGLRSAGGIYGPSPARERHIPPPHSNTTTFCELQAAYHGSWMNLCSFHDLS